MTTHVSVSPPVLDWLVDRSGEDAEDFTGRFPRWQAWHEGKARPTLRQAQTLARRAGVPFGYLLLPAPPTVELPVADFRQGFSRPPSVPSSDLTAVLNQSLRRQDWYRGYAEREGLDPVPVVGSGRGRAPEDVAAEMRHVLDFEVATRHGSMTEVRSRLLGAFERIGGLTVATSMVANNTHRLLDPDEFRGFTLVDDLAPLVFVNAAQTLNGQIFTLAHEYAHVWDGRGGISAADPRQTPDGVEGWCNVVASQFLVPTGDLRELDAGVGALPLTQRLEEVAREFRCGTLVVLSALRRDRLLGRQEMTDFDALYRSEVDRLRRLQPLGSGGQFYLSQPYRVGRRFSRAVIADTRSGGTSIGTALRLTSLSLEAYETYASALQSST